MTLGRVIAASPTARFPQCAAVALIVCSRAPKKWFVAERHFAPLHGNDLRRLTAFIADAKNPDVIAPRFKMLKRKSHAMRRGECASFGQHADIGLARVFFDNGMQLAMAHYLATLSHK
jgi:hypothetical protein